MIKPYRFDFSTNVERVELALAHKGIAVEKIDVDPEDRSVVRAVSGQDLVPVIVDENPGGTAAGPQIVIDSMEIVRYLEGKHPARPLYPADPARRSEMLVFIDWFNRVWKRPPNDIVAEMRAAAPDASRIERLGRAMTDALDPRIRIEIEVTARIGSGRRAAPTAPVVS